MLARWTDRKRHTGQDHLSRSILPLDAVIGTCQPQLVESAVNVATQSFAQRRVWMAAIHHECSLHCEGLRHSVTVAVIVVLQQLPVTEALPL
jgi:hypothetical protein